MRLFSRIFLILAAIVALSWFLLWIYDLAFPATWRSPFVQISPESGKWVVSKYVSDSGDPDIFEVDMDGTEGGHYTVEERDSLLPHVYFSRLMAKGVAPDSIAGVEVTMPLLRRNEAVLSVSPRYFIFEQPDIWLIMESLPPRFALEEPNEAFRFPEGGGVEFVSVETNSVMPERSRRFTEAFDRNGFSYPPSWLNANVTTRKAYDNGYLIIDAKGVVYHMKKQAGRPYMSRVEMPDGETARFAFITENTNREDVGLVISDTGRVYRLLADYSLQLMPGMTLDTSRQRMMLMSNYFTRVFRVASDVDVTWYGYDSATGELLGTYHVDIPKSTSAKVAEWIFPYRLTFTSGYDGYARPHITDFSPKAFIVVALFIIFVFGITKLVKSHKIR